MRRRQGGVRQHAMLATMGVAVYLLALWFGVTVVGDEVGRSAVVSAVIVLLAAGWYVSTARPRE